MPTPASQLNNGDWVLPKSSKSKTAKNVANSNSNGNYGITTRRSIKNKKTLVVKENRDNSNASTSTSRGSSSSRRRSSTQSQESKPKEIEVITIKEEPLDEVPEEEENSESPIINTNLQTNSEADITADLNAQETVTPALVSSYSLNAPTLKDAKAFNLEAETVTGPSSDAPADSSSNNPESTSPPIFRCDQCFKEFPTKSRLNGHCRVHLKGKYKCQDCGKEFSGPSPLKYHRWIHIGNGIRKYLCDFKGCEKRFKSSQDLKRHSLVHSGTRPYHCDSCDRSFNLEWVLREHKKIHEGIRPYKCDREDCSKSFYSHKDLKRHVIIHGNETPFKCDREDCSKEKKGFRRKDNFIRHLMVVHNIPKEEAKIISDKTDDKNGVHGVSSAFEMSNLMNLLCVKQKNFESARKATKILQIIFKHLDTLDVQRCSKVCRVWEEVASKLLKNVKMPELPSKITGNDLTSQEFAASEASAPTPLEQTSIPEIKTTVMPEVQPQESNNSDIGVLIPQDCEVEGARTTSAQTATNSRFTYKRRFLSKTAAQKAQEDEKRNAEGVGKSKPKTPTGPVPKLPRLTTTDVYHASVASKDDNLILQKLLSPRTNLQTLLPKPQQASVIVQASTSSSCSLSNISLDNNSNSNPLNFLAQVASQNFRHTKPPPLPPIYPNPITRPRMKYGAKAPSPTAALSIRLPPPPLTPAVRITTSSITSLPPNKPIGFENGIIFVGNAKVGKSHLCNEIFETYNSPTRFPLSQSVAVEEESSINRKIGWGTVCLAGKTYTIIDTPRLYNQSSSQQQGVNGKNMCIVASVVELCENLNTIVYVFRDSLTHFDLMMVQRLYQLVGSEHVLLLMNKLSEEELTIPNMEMTKNSIFKELKGKKLLNNINDFKLYGIKFRTAAEKKTHTGAWTAKFHDYFVNKSFYPRNMKIPDVCFKPNVIKHSTPYDETVVNKVKEDAAAIVANLRSGGGGTDLKYDELGLGIPIARHLVDIVTYVDEYRVRYDGNYEFLRKNEIRRRGPFTVAYNNLK